MKTETQTQNSTVGLIGYHPEMGELKPEAQIEATSGHYGKHWFLKSQIELKGRGITLLHVLTSNMLTPQAQHKVGWCEYQVTEVAFEKICKQHRIVTEILL